MPGGQPTGTPCVGLQLPRRDRHAGFPHVLALLSGGFL
jgi:hypothetical protein